MKKEIFLLMFVFILTDLRATIGITTKTNFRIEKKYSCEREINRHHKLEYLNKTKFEDKQFITLDHSKRKPEKRINPFAIFGVILLIILLLSVTSFSASISGVSIAIFCALILLAVILTILSTKKKRKPK